MATATPPTIPKQFLTSATLSSQTPVRCVPSAVPQPGDWALRSSSSSSSSSHTPARGFESLNQGLPQLTSDNGSTRCGAVLRFRPAHMGQILSQALHTTPAAIPAESDSFDVVNAGASVVGVSAESFWTTEKEWQTSVLGEHFDVVVRCRDRLVPGWAVRSPRWCSAPPRHTPPLAAGV